MKLYNILIITIFLLITFSSCDRWLGKVDYAEKGIVIEIGNTHGNEGFFSGPVETACKIRWEDGSEESMPVYGNVMTGQTVYKFCWTDSKGKSYQMSNAETDDNGYNVKKGYRYYKE